MAMELKPLLAEWRKIKPEMVEIGSIHTDTAFQPRNDRLPPFKDWGRMKKTSQQHTDTLTRKLEDGRNLAPVLVARIDGQLFVIDGHHRLDAYRRAKRESIPARIRDSTKKQAVRASLAVNCDFVKLPMHKEQCLDVAWQYIAMLTTQGKRELPQGISRRDIGRIFGVSHDTIANMTKRIGVREHRRLPPGSPPPRYRMAALEVREGERMAGCEQRCAIRHPRSAQGRAIGRQVRAGHRQVRNRYLQACCGVGGARERRRTS